MPPTIPSTSSIQHLWTHQARVLALYRSTLREARKLPHVHLRYYFVTRTRERFQSLKDVKAQAWPVRVKSLEVDFRRLQAANRGETLAVTRAIELAFGRRGKLRRQLLLPLTSCPPDAPLLIPQNPKSKLPIYSPTLLALITSAHGRSSGKAVSESDTRHPPILPAKADPNSEDAKFLGPLSKRREVNLRWRYYKEQVAAARAPLQPLAETSDNQIAWDPEKLFHMLEDAATAPSRVSPSSNMPTTNFPRSARFLRRRFAEALAKVPMIKSSSDGRTSVSISLKGLETSDGRARVRARPPSDESVRWLELANAQSKDRGGKTKDKAEQ